MSSTVTGAAGSVGERGRTPLAGLSDAEVAARVASGRTNATHDRASRSLSDIVRANVVTPFNAILAALLVVVLATGRWQDGLFAVVAVANVAIGIVQELRAKRTLDRLAILQAPRARVRRGGSDREVPIGEVVEGDLVLLRAGDQVPADGEVRTAQGLEVDESLLTGESAAVAKQAPGEGPPGAPRRGDTVRSGSTVVAGSGLFQADAVGAQAYATRIAAEARRYTVTRSELVTATTTVLRWVTLLMLVVGPLLLWSQLHSEDNRTWQDAVASTVAALVGMIPEGLVLLTSMAFAVGAISLARRGTLVQELPAVEGLARVDVLCLDKTGTLTHGDVELDHLEPCLDQDVAEVEQALALLCSGEARNPTAAAIARAVPVPRWAQRSAVPFSSARKWSAAVTEEHGTWVLGAPDVVLAAPAGRRAVEASAHARRLAAEGHRVLLLARSERRPVRDGDGVSLPPGLSPAAVVVLRERVREDARSTLRHFTEQGVGLMVVSGDEPGTVGALARRVGLPGADGPVDARTLPEDPGRLAALLADPATRPAVLGRASPQHKQRVVRALQAGGSTVAMTGDGVNDALALKDADLGIAMGGGSPATRAVAQLVLMDGRLSHLPRALAEGRRVMASMERTASLFLVKNVYAVLLAVVSAATLSAYPLSAVQLSLITALTIGVPGFFLALGPDQRRHQPGLLPRVMRFALPGGLVVAAVAYAASELTWRLGLGGSVAAAQTSATVSVLVVGLWILVLQARPLTRWRLLLVGGLGIASAALVLSPLGEVLLLLRVTPERLALGLALGAAGAAVVSLVPPLLERRARVQRPVVPSTVSTKSR